MGNKNSKTLKRNSKKSAKQNNDKKSIVDAKPNNVVNPEIVTNSIKTKNETNVFPSWLIIKGDFDVKLIENCELNEVESNLQDGFDTVFVPNYKLINDLKSPDLSPLATKDSWQYYRDIASYSAGNPQIALIPKMSYFIFAQFYDNTISNKIIPESLRLSLLTNLYKLSKDKSIKYDIRDANTGQYLYYKTKQFGISKDNISKMLEMNKGWLSSIEDCKQLQMDSFKQEIFFNDDDDDESSIPGIEIEVGKEWGNGYKIEPCFDENDCMIYKINNLSENSHPKNTTIIHDLIDPNKNLFENKLWIPTIFDCTTPKNFNHVQDIIKSPIVGLDYVKYKSLYIDIAKIFKICIQPMFENVLNYKLGSKEKIFVKSMKYVLQKPLDFYDGNIHREGMGENIVGIAIYYPQVDGKNDGMDGGKLKLSIPDVCNSFLKCGNKEIEIKQGSCIVFSNQGYHQLPVMNHIGIKQKAVSRTILTFFIVNQYNSEMVKASDNNGLYVNLQFYWKYYINFWLRQNGFNHIENNYEWMKGVVFMFLFENNFKDYVYYKRYKMRIEKSKPLFRTVLPNYESNLSGEETFYTANYRGFDRGYES